MHWLRIKLRNLERNGLKTLQNWWREILAIIAIIVLIVASILIWAGNVWLVTGRWPEWTGFGEYIGPVVLPNQTFQRAKTLWDWMQLLIVPAVIAIGAFLLNESARQREMKHNNDIALNELQKDFLTKLTCAYFKVKKVRRILDGSIQNDKKEISRLLINNHLPLIYMFHYRTLAQGDQQIL